MSTYEGFEGTLKRGWETFAMETELGQFCGGDVYGVGRRGGFDSVPFHTFGWPPCWKHAQTGPQRRRCT